MKNEFKQGIYKLPVSAREKYIGDKSNIVYRSSWEKKILDWLANSSKILKFSSEEIIINYVSKADGRVHKYFMDFYFEYIDKAGNVKKVLAEVKPYAQTIPPKQLKEAATPKQKHNYLNACLTYQKNQDKWKATKEICKEKNLDFVILTERNTGGTFL